MDRALHLFPFPCPGYQTLHVPPSPCPGYQTLQLSFPAGEIYPARKAILELALGHLYIQLNSMEQFCRSTYHFLHDPLPNASIEMEIEPHELCQALSLFHHLQHLHCRRSQKQSSRYIL